jgi:hypothetical protein
LFDAPRDFVFHFREIGDARLAPLDQHRHGETVLDAHAVADVVRLLQRPDRIFKLRRTADLRHVVARFDERRLTHHLARAHVRFRRQFLRHLLKIFRLLQTLFGALGELGGGLVGARVALRDEQFALGLFKRFRD